MNRGEGMLVRWGISCGFARCVSDEWGALKGRRAFGGGVCVVKVITYMRAVPTVVDL